MNSLLEGKTHEYISETPELNLKIIEQLFLNDFSMIDIAIIKSQQGCGGTHLLRDIGFHLIEEGKEVCCISAMKLSKAILNNQETTTGFLLNQSFVLVDDLDFLFRSNDVTLVNWLKLFLRNFIREGSKFIFSHTSLSLSLKDSLVHFDNYRTAKLSSNYPSYYVLKLIAQQHVPIDVIRKHGEGVYQESTCTRTFLNQLISIYTRSKLSYRL